MFKWIKKLLDSPAEAKNGKARLKPVKTKDTALKDAFRKIKAEKQKTEARINKVFSRINLHQNTIVLQNKKIDNIISEIMKLKELIRLNELQKVTLNDSGDHERLSHRPNPTNISDKTIINPENFTISERKIIASLIEHREMALSYDDLAKLLNRSSTTVKNEINNLKKKTTILVEQTDSNGKKRYKLKDGVKLEKYFD